MTNFKQIQSMSLEDFAKWLDENGQFDTAPWSGWFSKKYCDKCESIKCKYADAEEKLGLSPFARYNGEVECAYCELEGRCKFFPDLEDVPDNLETIKMWLAEEANR